MKARKEEIRSWLVGDSEVTGDGTEGGEEIADEGGSPGDQPVDTGSQGNP